MTASAPGNIAQRYTIDQRSDGGLIVSIRAGTTSVWISAPPALQARVAEAPVVLGLGAAPGGSSPSVALLSRSEAGFLADLLHRYATGGTLDGLTLGVRVTGDVVPFLPRPLAPKR